jgi:hypothetical protein
MGVSIVITTYADFQATVASLSKKVSVYYFTETSGSCLIWAVSRDFDALVHVTLSAQPSTLTTDYPGAVAFDPSQGGTVTLI